jgi:apolipoprotein N-acyltransferase
LLGSIAIEDATTPKERWYNGAFVVSPQFGVQHDYYAKRHLVPFGEYVPLRPIFGWLGKVVPLVEDTSPGPDSSPLIVRLKGEPVVFGPLICYEDVFPDLARYSVRAESNVLVVLTNDGWYGEGAGAYQHAAHSVLRAVELRRPVLRCGNGGWSGWIDEFGSIRAVLTRDAQGVIHTEPKDAENGTIYFRGTATVNVFRDSRWITARTFYAQHGDWFVVLSAVLVALGWATLQLAAKWPRASAAGATEADAGAE